MPFSVVPAATRIERPFESDFTAIAIRGLYDDAQPKLVLALVCLQAASSGLRRGHCILSGRLSRGREELETSVDQPQNAGRLHNTAR